MSDQISSLLKELPNTRKRTPYNFVTLRLLRHLQACLRSVGDITRSPLTTAMIVIVIAISIAMPTGLYILLQNAKQLAHSWDQTSQITLYLKMDTSDVDSLLKQLRQRPDIKQAKYISPQEGLAEFQQRSGFGEVLNGVTNPLPGAILITPQNTRDANKLTQLVAEFKQLPQVELAQLDMDWVNRLSALVSLAQRAVDTLGVLLAVGVLLIIANTIHLATQNYQQEIAVFKLVGATDSFIRRPFLYMGILYGFLGGILAWLFVSAGLFWLESPIDHLNQIYNSSFYLQGLGFSRGICLLFISMNLGFIGAFIAVTRYLKTN